MAFNKDNAKPLLGAVDEDKEVEGGTGTKFSSTFTLIVSYLLSANNLFHQLVAYAVRLCFFFLFSFLIILFFLPIRMRQLVLACLRFRTPSRMRELFQGESSNFESELTGEGGV